MKKAITLLFKVRFQCGKRLRLLDIQMINVDLRPLCYQTTKLYSRERIIDNLIGPLGSIFMSPRASIFTIGCPLSFKPETMNTCFLPICLTIFQLFSTYVLSRSININWQSWQRSSALYFNGTKLSTTNNFGSPTVNVPPGQYLIAFLAGTALNVAIALDNVWWMEAAGWKYTTVTPTNDSWYTDVNFDDRSWTSTARYPAAPMRFQMFDGRPMYSNWYVAQFLLLVIYNFPGTVTILCFTCAELLPFPLVLQMPTAACPS